MSERVISQIDVWRNRLLDLTKRNPLINCKIGPRGSIRLEFPEVKTIWPCLLEGEELTFVWKRELVEVDEEVREPEDTMQLSLFDAEAENRSAKTEARISLEDCLASDRLQPDHLLSDLTDRALGSRLNRLSLNARTALSEQGINILFVAFGFLKWYESETSDTPLLSPLLLVPASLSRIGTTAPWTISLYEEEVTPNYCLQELMKRDLSLSLPDPNPEALLDDPTERLRFLGEVHRCIQDQRRWEILDIAALGQFSFQKLAMYEDYGRNAETIASHEHCQRIAGDEAAPAPPAIEIPPTHRLDAEVKPIDLHTVLPCDASQLEAILAVKRGASLILDGPPGTGKSQTITNLIGECLADGKTVLFVSEKAAALDVVKRRLDDQGLGDFVLDCHSHKANKKEVISELGRCLGLHPEEYPNRNDDLNHLFHTREKLNAYVASLHHPRSELQISAFEAHGRLVQIGECSISRCSVRNVFGVSSQNLREMENALTALKNCRAVLEAFDTHPWRGCVAESFNLTLEDEVCHHFHSLADALDALQEFLTPLAEARVIDGNLPWQDVTEQLHELNQLLVHPAVPMAWLESSPRQIVSQILLLENRVGAFRERLDDAEEFASDALNGELPSEGQVASMVEADEWSNLVKPHSAGTVRTFIPYLLSLAEDLTNLAHQVDEMGRLAWEVIDSLDVKIKTPRLGQYDRLVDLGRQVAASDEFRPVWFDPGEAAAIQNLARQGLALSEQIATRRTRLEERLAPAAFESEGRQVAEDAANYGSLWKRWLPGWRNCRGRASKLYLENPPPTQTLLHDLEQLHAHHTDREALTTLSAGQEDRLARYSDGTIHWQAVLDGILAAESLQSLLGKVPSPLVLALCTEGRVDRDYLMEASNQLGEAVDRFRNHLQTVRRQFACTRPGPAGEQFGQLRADDFADWLRSAAGALAHRANQLETICPLLRSDRDIQLNELRERFAGLVAAKENQAQVHSAYQAVSHLTDVVDCPESHDWSPWVQRAKFLNQLLNQYGESVPEELVAVVAETPTRQHVASNSSQALDVIANRLEPSWRFLERVFPTEELVSEGLVLSRISIPVLTAWVRRQIEQLAELRDWIDYRQLESRFDKLGLREVLAEVVHRDYAVDDALPAFLTRFYRQWLDEAYRQDAVLREFRFEEHERLISEFRNYDHCAIQSGRGRIRTKLLNAPERPHCEMLNAPPSSELGILLKEVNKKRRHLPLRQLFAKVPGLLLRIKPCLMMSPLAVSTYLDSSQLRFDLVIFDEASQVLPWDAIGAVYRGHQLVVAGDQKQLPPTTFFDRMLEDGDSENDDGLADFESVLDVLCSLGLPRRRLRWHYRSRREPLIAFSNRHFYDNELVTFPSPDDLDDTTAVRLVHVPNGRWRSGAGFNPLEARRVAELVAQHFERHPDRTLGVITFNQRQQMAVLDELAKLRKDRRDLEEFFAEGREEGLFVKNLENVQGDERDRIILSVAYGLDETTEKLAMRFGPLNNQGGERRLNVAVTRAREAVTLVSSIRSEDIDLSRTNALGVRFLKAYLAFAEHGPEAMARGLPEQEGGFESPFEAAVAQALLERGLDVRSQVGCGGFRIDLGIVHPEVPGRFVLGVECDGATYHRTATARDRDRIRQEVLENLGWRMARVWSTDWIRDPSRQIERLLTAYRTALENPPAPVAEQPEEVEEPPIIKLREVTTDHGRASYQDINDVPEPELNRLVLKLTVQFGATAQEDLIKGVSKELGFQRTGTRIKRRIAAAIKNLLRKGRLQDEGEDRVSAV